MEVSESGAPFLGIKEVGRSKTICLERENLSPRNGEAGAGVCPATAGEEPVTAVRWQPGSGQGGR